MSRMEEIPETVLIAVDTNFDTNLIVIPPRSATIADVRERIKQGHMTLYPSYGSINVLTVKVELFNRYYLLEESQKVGQIFRGWQGCLHVELADCQPSSPTASRLRLPLISAGDTAQASLNRSLKHSVPRDEEQDDKHRESLDKVPAQVPVQPEVSLPARQIPDISPNVAVVSDGLEVVGSQKSSDARNSSERFFRSGSQDVVLDRQATADGQGIETVQAGLDTAVDAPLDVSTGGHVNVGRSRDLTTDSNRHNVLNKDTLAGTHASTQSTPRKAAAHVSGDSKLLGQRKRRAGDALNLTGSQDLPVGPATSLKQVGGSVTKKNKVRGVSDISTVNVNESLVKGIPDVAKEIADDKKTVVGAPNDVSSSDNVVRKDVKGSFEQAAKVDLPSGAETPKGRTTDSINQSKSSEKAVVAARQVGKPQEEVRSKAGKFHSSGSSSSESTEKSKEKERKNAPDLNPSLKRSEAQAKKSSDDSSSSGSSSQSYRPEGSAGPRDVDEVVKNLVNLYSPIISDDSRGEQSSDASEERQPKGLRRRMNSNAVDEVDNAAGRNSRRSSRTSAGLNKFQHFIDSQDGLDQLLGLTLSNRKSKPSSEVEPEPQVPAAQRGALAVDSLLIDVVPDTQVGNLICDGSAQREVYTEETAPVERTTEKGQEDGDVRPVQDGSSDKRPHGKDEEKTLVSICKETTLSADANDDPSKSLKNFASIASESARKLDSKEDLLQPKSDDSHQFQGAVHLVQLQMADEEDDAKSDPIESPKDSSRKKKTTKVNPGTSSATFRENDVPVNIEDSPGMDPPRSGLATSLSDLKEDTPVLPADHLPQEVGVDKAGAVLISPRNIEGIPEQSVDHTLKKNGEEVNAVIEAVARSAMELQEENVEEQVEEVRQAPVVEDSEALDPNQDRSELVTPSKTLGKKKLNPRRLKGERNAKEKEKQQNSPEEGDRRDKEGSVTAEKMDVVPYVEDSPVKEARAGAEAQDEPSISGKGRPAEKSGRKKRAKKGTWPADSPENEKRGEEKSDHSLLEDNGKCMDILSDEKQALSRTLEAEEVGVENGLGVKNKTGAIATPPKKKKKKLKADGGSHSNGSKFAIAEEAFAKVSQIRSNSILSLHPSNADGGFTYEPLTSGSRAEQFASPDESARHLASEEAPGKPLISKKKKKAKGASSLERAAPVTDSEVENRQKEMNQVASDTEAAIPVPELGRSKPPRPRGKKGTKHVEHMSTAAEKVSSVTPEEVEEVLSEQPGKYSTEKHSKELKRRKLVEEVEFADLDSKDGILTPKTIVSVDEDPSKKVTSERPSSVEGVRKKKKKTPGGIEGDIRPGVLNIYSSPSREDGAGAKRCETPVAAVDNIREGGMTDTPKKKRKKRSSTLSAAEDENDDALEPSCNQLGYRGGGVSELNRDVSRNFDPVDDVFWDDKSTEAHSKSKTKRAKSVMNDVEKTVSASSPTVENPGSRAPKPKKRKNLTNQEFNGAAFKAQLRPADGRFLRAQNIRPEEAAPCLYPGCERNFPKKSSSWFRHTRFCQFRPDGLHVPEPNKVNRKKRKLL